MTSSNEHDVITFVFCRLEKEFHHPYKEMIPEIKMKLKTNFKKEKKSFYCFCRPSKLFIDSSKKQQIWRHQIFFWRHQILFWRHQIFFCSRPFKCQDSDFFGKANAFKSGTKDPIVVLKRLKFVDQMGRTVKALEQNKENARENLTGIKWSIWNLDFKF